MLALPKSRLLRTLLLWTTVSAALCYSWLGVRALEPTFQLPPALIHSAIWIDQHSVLTLEDARESHWREAAQALKETEFLELALSGVQGPEANSIGRVDLVVRGDDRGRLLITDSRIEIGSDVLRASGQLSKAILSSFLLRHASPDIAGSHFRITVASDALLAMLSGGLGLHVPGEDQALEFPKLKPWWSTASSYRDVCASPWRSLELRTLCQARSQVNSGPTLLSMRPLVGRIIWDAFKSKPVGERLAFVKRWIAALGHAKAHESEDGFRETVLSEVETLLPTTEFADVRVSLERSMIVTRIKKGTEPHADLIVRSLQLGQADRDSLKRLAERNPRRLILAIADHQVIVFPSAMMFSEREFSERGRAEVRAQQEVWQSCQAPTMGEVANSRPPHAGSKRIVWVRDCSERQVGLAYGSLLTSERMHFAKENPQLAVVQLRPEAIQLAIRDGRAKNSDFVDQFLLRQTRRSQDPWFGLADAKWDQDSMAFRVKGAIEAVEWHHIYNQN